MSAEKVEILNELVNTSLVDVLTEKIRHNIYTGKYHAGKRLVVRELSNEFGVSHTPIKEALNRLISEGYVEKPPRRSMVVRKYSNSELIDALETRLMIEIFSADRIIRAAAENPEIVKEMDSIMASMRNQMDDKENLSYEDWVSNETRFHGCYMRYCGNDKLFSIYKELDTNKTTYLAYMGTTNLPLKLSTLDSNLMEHQAITEAIRTLSTEKLINAVIRHIDRACNDYATDEECLRKCRRIREIKEKYET